MSPSTGVHRSWRWQNGQVVIVGADAPNGLAGIISDARRVGVLAYMAFCFGFPGSQNFPKRGVNVNLIWWKKGCTCEHHKLKGWQTLTHFCENKPQKRWQTLTRFCENKDRHPDTLLWKQTGTQCRFACCVYRTAVYMAWSIHVQAWHTQTLSLCSVMESSHTKYSTVKRPNSSHSSHSHSLGSITFSFLTLDTNASVALLMERRVMTLLCDTLGQGPRI